MSKRLQWDTAGERYYEVGVSKGVVFPMANGAYSTGEAWSGLTNVTESPSGAEANPFYADNIKYFNIVSAEDYGASIEAYMYPDGFADCLGEKEIAKGVSISQQPRSSFGFSYVNQIGSDTDGESHGYKIHLVYGCFAAPTEKSHDTINESVEPGTMSWEISTTPVAVSGMKPTAHLCIDSTKCDPDQLEKLEDIIYGTEEAESRLPLPDEVAKIMSGS